MKFWRQLGSLRTAVFVCTAGIFILWLVWHVPDMIGTQNGLIRFVLSVLFSLLILFRPKGGAVFRGRRPGILWVGATFVGMLAVVSGIVFSVHQFEWLGILLLLCACFSWALPVSFSHDVFLSMFVLYWAHPLPGHLFGGIELWMQKMSVTGGAWLLHVFNVRVWADGMALKTGVSVFGVPEWCSGMRTATTVFLLVLGIGILKRLRWYECAVAMLAGVSQALILNIFRICTMVVVAPKVGAGSGLGFLHDTAGLIVITAVFLVYLEISVWRGLKDRRRALKQKFRREMDNQLSQYPFCLHRLAKYKWVILALPLAGLLLAILLFKSRPYHRALMMKDVMILQRENGNLEDAERLGKLIHLTLPDDVEWSLEVIRLLVMRGKFEEAIEEIDDPVLAKNGYETEKKILKAYCLMGIRRIDEAETMINKLPRSVRENDPRAAMILAEMARRADDPDTVAKMIVTAARWRGNSRRIRVLYPYLRRYRKWSAIAETETGRSYVDMEQTMSAIEAYMNINEASVVANMALKAVERWPNDVRVLEPLFFMTIKRGTAEWEDMFVAQLIRSIAYIDDPDELNKLFGKCFRLMRPDLAWAVHCRISEIDPNHPVLYLSAAEYGDVWFVFRKRFLGIGSHYANDTINVRSFFLVGQELPAWRQLCRDIPMGRELAGDDVESARKNLRALALKEFKKRSEQKSLSLEMMYEYTRAMDMEGMTQEVRDWLQRVAAGDPLLQRRNRIIMSGIYEREGDWHKVYEVLRGHLADKHPHLSALRRLCKAQEHIRLGLASLHTARQAVILFPYSSISLEMLVSALIRNNMPEEALLVLCRPRTRYGSKLDMQEIRCLHKTQRFTESEKFCRSRMLPVVPVGDKERQPLVLPPAELSAMWRRISMPSEKAFAMNAEALRATGDEKEKSQSPFLKRIEVLWLEHYGRRDGAFARGGLEEETERWLLSGRNKVEQATALNQLTLLLCRDRKFADARNAASLAVDLMPESPVLWRILLDLSGCDEGVLTSARKACPYDSELWLAEIVVRTQKERRSSEEGRVREPGWVVDMVSEAAKSKMYSPAAMTRAGDYLLRGNMNKAAVIAAKDAVTRARGLAPAYLLGLRCAIAVRDKEWALDCAKKTIDSLLDPPAFLYEKLVQLKVSTEDIDIDGDMVDALTELREERPDDPRWAEMFGYVRFKRGGWEIVDAMHQMMSAMAANSTNKVTFVVAAESARIIGNLDQAVFILRDGLKMHPDDLAMENNLAYVLVQTEEGQNEALQLAVKLLGRAPKNASVLDTVATVYLRCGELKKSEKILLDMLGLTEKGEKLWFRAKMHLAEIAIENGEKPRARSMLELMMGQSRDIPNEDIVEANKLLQRAKK